MEQLASHSGCLFPGGSEKMAFVGHYQAFCLEILSEIPLQLPQYNKQDNSIDPTATVRILYGDVHILTQVTHTIGSIAYGRSDDGSGTVVHIPRIADVFIKDDSIVIVQPVSGSNELLIAQIISTMVLLFLMKRQPLVTLHGSAISTGAKAIVLVGQQGVGKSTTAAAMVLQGSHMLCDDTVPIGLTDRSNNRCPIVFPGIPRPKLLGETYQEMFGDTSEALHLFDGVDKYQVPLETDIVAVPLQVICVLSERSRTTHVEYHQLLGSKKISAIMSHVSVFQGIESINETFMRTVGILKEVPVYEILRPKGMPTINDVVRLISRIATVH